MEIDHIPAEAGEAPWVSAQVAGPAAENDQSLVMSGRHYNEAALVRQSHYGGCKGRSTLGSGVRW